MRDIFIDNSYSSSILRLTSVCRVIIVIAVQSVWVEVSEESAARYDSLSENSGAGSDRFYRMIAEEIRYELGA